MRSPLTRTGIGLLIAFLAASMALPIPFTNTLPAGGIFLIGFSLLEEDGIILLGGLAYSVLVLAVSTAVIAMVIIFGAQAEQVIRESVKSLF